MIAISGSSASPSPATRTRDPEMAKAAQAFEAIFVRQMIGAMRSASLSEGMFDTGATEQFRDMADARTADNLAQSGAMGIAELLLKQLAPQSTPVPSPVDAQGTTP